MSLRGALWDPLFRLVAVLGQVLEQQRVVQMGCSDCVQRWSEEHGEIERSPRVRCLTEKMRKLGSQVERNSMMIISEYVEKLSLTS